MQSLSSPTGLQTSNKTVLAAIIKRRLSEVRTREEAHRVWSEYWSDLAGYTFILSEALEGDAPWLPSRFDFPEGGFLRSAFIHRHLYFVNCDYVSMSNAGRTVEINATYSIAFDTNVASYLRAWRSGKSMPVVSSLQSAMRHLGCGRINWDILPYLRENSAAILENRDLEKIYETAVAVEWFNSLDHVFFAKTGKARSVVDESEIRIGAQEALAKWHRHLVGGFRTQVDHEFRMVYVCILKLVQLQLLYPKRDQGSRKFELFLEFMDVELRSMFMMMIVAALELFFHGSAWKPMEKVANRSTRLRESARNVAWDFVHALNLQMAAGFNERLGGFYVPYFMTFDRGLAEIIDLDSRRSCLLGGEYVFPLFFIEQEFETRLLERFPEAEASARRVLSAAGAERRGQPDRDFDSRTAALIEDLELQIAAFGSD